MMKMRMLCLMMALSSQMALGSVCGTSTAEVAVSGLGINFDAEAPVTCTYTKSAGSVTGLFTVRIKDMKTGITLRDEHLADALKATDNPELKFSLTAWPVKSGPIAGELTLNGKTLPVKDWQAVVDGSKVRVKGTVDYTAYGLESAKYKKAGVTLATCPNVVGVSVEISL